MTQRIAVFPADRHSLYEEHGYSAAIRSGDLLLGVRFPGRTLGIHALVADASLSGLNRDIWHHFNDGDMARMITICPLAGTQLFQIQALLAPDDSQNFSADVLTAFLTERIGRTDVRIHSIPWVSKYQMNARIAEHYRVGKVFLAGDAAHVHPPTASQTHLSCRLVRPCIACPTRYRHRNGAGINRNR